MASTLNGSTIRALKVYDSSFHFILHVLCLQPCSRAGKTNEIAKQLSSLGVNSTLLIDGIEINNAFARATRNIPKTDILPCQGANVYDILRRETLILTRDAVHQLEERLK